MAVCKYFMQGYCKYGSRCKYDHDHSYSGLSSKSADYSSNERPSGTSILKGANANASFGGQELNHSFIQSPQQNSYPQKLSPGLQFNVHDTMLIISKDISQSEKGNQWQLSSYSPLKDLPNIPGLEDYSPEELRWEFYKALQNGTLLLWQTIVQQLFVNATKINNELKRKDSGYIIIDRWLRDIGEKCTHSTLSSQFGNSHVEKSSFTNPSQVYTTTDNEITRNSSFSFNISQGQSVNVQTYPIRGSVVETNQSMVFPHSNLQSFLRETDHNQTDSQTYSTIEELREEELEAFKSETFVLGTIPTKPPPKQLCNL